jgi:hypothetical protein
MGLSKLKTPLSRRIMATVAGLERGSAHRSIVVGFHIGADGIDALWLGELAFGVHLARSLVGDA